MILLKDILLEMRLYAYSTQELLDKLLDFSGKTLILLDTELTGLEPNVSYTQITEISALAVDGSTMKPLEDFSVKVNLTHKMLNLLNDPNSREAQSFEKARQRSLRKYKKDITHPSELLRLTNYYTVNANQKKMSEPESLQGLIEFIKKFPNPVLVAHNATFDMKALQARLKYNRLPPLAKYHVIDTMKISRFFFIPALLSLENNEEAKGYLEQLVAKTKYKSYSSSLGRLANIFKVKIDGWHQAKEDVIMLFEILRKLIEYLRSHADLDIRKQKGIQAKRWRHF